MFLLFDTETSGLFDYRQPADAPGQPRMASIAAALITDKGEIAESFYELVQPDGWSEDVIARSAEAFDINRLSMKLLMDEGKPVADVLAMFDALVDQCTGISAYGVTFDQKVVRAEQRLAGRPDRYGERPTFCVMHAAKPLCGMKKMPKLIEAVRSIFGEDLPDAHDAQADLRATVRLFTHMMERDLVTWKPQVANSEDAATLGRQVECPTPQLPRG